jgi:uncharacterized lipoprotein
MNPTRVLLTMAMTGVLLAAGGCKALGGGCNKPGAYASAQELPPLRVPAGLDGPDTRQSMQIPELNEPEAPRDPDGPCLEEPPAIQAPATPAGQAPAGGAVR